MIIFITGVNGQLGHDVALCAAKAGHKVICSDVNSGEDDAYIRLDITDGIAVSNAIETVKPDCIIHCAAWTNVDGAEDEKNREKVYAINEKGTQYLAEAAKSVNAKFVYISTDYVFGGDREKPWRPDDKNFNPLNEYGKSKLAGETAVSGSLEKFFIVRTSWVFGINGKNFIKTIVNLGRTHKTVRVVNDQIGAPTYAKDLAKLLIDMAQTDKYGYYHATNSGGHISWYDFTKEIYKQAGIDATVIPVTTSEYGFLKAARPLNSGLDCSKLAENGFAPMPDWRDAVKRYLKEANI